VHCWICRLDLSAPESWEESSSSSSRPPRPSFSVSVSISMLPHFWYTCFGKGGTASAYADMTSTHNTHWRMFGVLLAYRTSPIFSCTLFPVYHEENLGSIVLEICQSVDAIMLCTCARGGLIVSQRPFCSPLFQSSFKSIFKGSHAHENSGLL
jgi:hypothetical protein